MDVCRVFYGKLRTAIFFPANNIRKIFDSYKHTQQASREHALKLSMFAAMVMKNTHAFIILYIKGFLSYVKCIVNTEVPKLHF